MRRSYQISLLVLLMLASSCLSEAGTLQAQEHYHKQYGPQLGSKKEGPPDWAPAHGYRRKMDHKDKKHKGKKDKKKEDHLKHKEEELKRREEELNRREEALRRKEHRTNGPKGTFGKRRSQETEDKESAGGIFRGKTKIEEMIEKKKEEERMRQEEIKRKLPGKQEGDWNGGSGW